MLVYMDYLEPQKPEETMEFKDPPVMVTPIPKSFPDYILGFLLGGLLAEGSHASPNCTKQKLAGGVDSIFS